MAAARHPEMQRAEAQLNRTFAALTDPTRRAILARLEREPGLSVGELARPLAPLKLPGIMKHLDVLEEAGLVARRKTGRIVAVNLIADPMADAMAWLRRYERFWSPRLDRLAAFTEAQEKKVRESER
jgi:DNA-binding transcriptional ArsR family regulator